MKGIRKCLCKEILKSDRIYLHLTGCPDSFEYKEYQKLKWWKKIFSFDPYFIYKIHIKDTLGKI